MIKREDMKEMAEALARTMDPSWEDKDKRSVALMFVEMIESWIECNRARAQYYMRPTRRYRMEE